MQQNVEGPTGVTEPLVTPPLGGHVPGVYVAGPLDLLPSAEPVTPKQSGAAEVTVTASSAAPLHVVFV
jgi:hypothetical protein